MCVFRFDSVSCFDFLKTLNYHSVVGAQALLNYPVGADPIGCTHLAERDSIISVENGQFKLSLQFLYCALRNQKSALVDVGSGANPGVLAGAQDISGIWEDASNPECSGCGVDLSADDVNLALMAVDGSVRQDQLQRISLRDA